MSKHSQSLSIINQDGTVFQQVPGQSILDASIEADYPISHSCRSGRCGFCKVKLLSGETLAYRNEELTTQERDNNWICTCARSAISDIKIDAGPLNKVTIPNVVRIPCAIATLIHLSDDVLHVTLQLPLVVRFSYLAGQYINITNAEGVCRSYSLATAKVSDQTIALHIRKVEQGTMTNFWFNQAKVQELLTLEGPKGSFFLRDVANRDIYMLATGTGIAPIKAMLDAHASLPEDCQAASITVIWGGRKPSDFYLDITTTGKVNFIATLCVPSPSWTGTYGYVQKVLLSLNPNMLNARVYACGSPAMIKQAQQTVINHGLDPQYFLADAFVYSGDSG